MNDTLPHVGWHGRRISRLVVGHNPPKGNSHFSEPLSGEMKAHFDPPAGAAGLALLRRCERCGIETAQFGGAALHELRRRFAEAGGRMRRIATFYDGGDPKAELEAVLAVRPRPVGIQYFGEKTDAMFIDRRMDVVRSRLAMFRDTGLLVGLCTHLPQVGEFVESAGWDVDFYQTCFYTVYSYLPDPAGGPGRIDRARERYDDADRGAMVRFIRRTPRPCLAFKVLAANRKCTTPAEVEAALRFAYENIKPIDAVAVGMWLKHADQVAANAAAVRRILSAGK